MNSFRRQLYVLLIGFLSTISAIAPRGAHAQTPMQCFNVPGIEYCIQGRFLEYWRDNGGLEVFGYPVTPERLEQTAEGVFTVQYFERNRFEFHPEKQRPYDVLLGRLGDDRLRQLEWDWRTNEVPGWQRDDCSWWPQTRHSICGPFRAYWESHGLQNPALDRTNRSLQLFGLPLSEARMETNTSGDTVLTQWFERARFEYHADKNIVLLGLLGNELLRNPEVPFNVLDYAIVDVDWFWIHTFQEKGWNYQSPAGGVVKHYTSTTGCGGHLLEMDNAAYCHPTQTVYLSMFFLLKKKLIGNMAAVTVIAHEWGHHVQNQLGITDDDVDTELQADCFAGAFAKDADERGLLTDHAIDDVRRSYGQDEARGGLPPDHRLKEFMWGYQHGVDACL